jgi:hypothetical protein
VLSSNPILIERKKKERERREGRKKSKEGGRKKERGRRKEGGKEEGGKGRKEKEGKKEGSYHNLHIQATSRGYIWRPPGLPPTLSLEHVGRSQGGGRDFRVGSETKQQRRRDTIGAPCCSHL